MGTPAQRRRKGGIPLVRVFTFVAVIHLVAGSGIYWIAKTSAGQAFAKTYNIKLFQEPPAPEPQAQEPPPEPPPPKIEQAQTPPPAPTQTASLPAAAPAPTIGASAGGGGGWTTGGRFAGGFDGPDAALRAALTGRLRDCMTELGVEEASFPAVAVDFGVNASGAVKGIRLVRPSGDGASDARAQRIAECAAAKGSVPAPDAEGRIVTVQFRPTH